MPIHPLDPVWDRHSRVLVLGSFPSVRSREIGFYYAHPQNRFWPVLADVFGESIPRTTQERKAFALCHGVALWDVIASCEINGSSDASIRNVVPNDIASLLNQSAIMHILCNGKRAHDLYMRFCAPVTGVSAILLPSTSAANAAWPLPKLAEAWAPFLLRASAD